MPDHCEHCGAEVKDHDNVCPKCGYHFRLERLKEFNKSTLSTLDSLSKEIDAKDARIKELEGLLFGKLDLPEFIQTLVQRDVEMVLKFIEADPHKWSSRPCATCRSISAIAGKPFGCVVLEQEHVRKQIREAVFNA